jgi:hypothetical protein
LGKDTFFLFLYDPFLQLPRFQNTTLRFLVTNPYIQVQRIANPQSSNWPKGQGSYTLDSEDLECGGDVMASN